jgi:CMP-N,N'-diacetyllegionaminic acid synthase
MKTLAVVPARGGSKGLPGKNARPFLGVSLLERAIRVALETCDHLVVSTDSQELADIADAMGYGACVHMRPAELATDEAPMLPVVQDAIRGREGDVIVLLQPTQPLRTAGQVRAAIRMLQETGAESVVSVKEVPEAYSPDRVLVQAGGRLMTPADGFPHDSRRQEARQAFVRDGTVYAVLRHVVEARGGYAGSLYGLDCRALPLPGAALSIDTLEDLKGLEASVRLREIALEMARERVAMGATDSALYQSAIKLLKEEEELNAEA